MVEQFLAEFLWLSMVHLASRDDCPGLEDDMKTRVWVYEEHGASSQPWKRSRMNECGSMQVLIKPHFVENWIWHGWKEMLSCDCKSSVNNQSRQSIRESPRVVLRIVHNSGESARPRNWKVVYCWHFSVIVNSGSTAPKVWQHLARHSLQPQWRYILSIVIRFHDHVWDRRW